MMRTVICLFTLLVVQTAAELVTLEPFTYLTGELLDLDTGVKPYRLAGLKPNTGYEVRVSWPASIPASIKFELVDGAADQNSKSPLGKLTRKSARRLLDTEKLVFHTDREASVQDFRDPQVLISASRRSVHRDGPNGGPSKIVYNIVVAELVIGIPRDALPVVGAVLLSVVLAIVWTFYWSGWLYPWLLVWLTTSDTLGSSPAAGTSKRDS